jgi:hypothetical protein
MKLILYKPTLKLKLESKLIIFVKRPKPPIKYNRFVLFRFHFQIYDSQFEKIFLLNEYYINPHTYIKLILYKSTV